MLDLILLIDDDRDDNFIHSRLIQKMGVCKRFHTCTNGLEALAFLKNADRDIPVETKYPKPDLIFLDINMPKMNGWQFLEAYQKLPDYLKGGPIIAMLTTSKNPDDLARAQALGMIKEYLTKPLRQDTLIGLIEQHFPAKL